MSYLEQAEQAKRLTFTFSMFVKLLHKAGYNPDMCVVHDSIIATNLPEGVFEDLWNQAERIWPCEICLERPATGNYVNTWHVVYHCDLHESEGLEAMQGREVLKHNQMKQI